MVFSSASEAVPVVKTSTMVYHTMVLFSVLCTLMLDLPAGQVLGATTCRSPLGMDGECIGIRQCPRLLSMIQNPPLTPDVVDTLQKSQCGRVGDNPEVCCPRPAMERIETGNQEDPYDLSNNELLPSDCGKEITQRIAGGEQTELDEFPWMALLEYNLHGKRSTECGGVLINSRYVLTAAHCVKNATTLEDLPLRRVHLGEYDTTTDPDCLTDEDGSPMCADRRVSVAVEETVPHGSYRPTQTEKGNDIALVRLAREVVYTHFVKPICLPRTSSLGAKLVSAGWGFTERGTPSNVKLKITLPPVERSKCIENYSRFGIKIGYGQICAGGEPKKDTCRGDSGGPLMSVHIDSKGVARWIVHGVVSFGPVPCGSWTFPGVYTKVFDFLPWILENIRP